jgi:hypothetical protein
VLSLTTVVEHSGVPDGPTGDGVQVFVPGVSVAQVVAVTVVVWLMVTVEAGIV